MTFLTLDLSKRSTGWAVWSEGWAKPHYGHWQLGSEFTSPGGVFGKLHERMAELHAVMPFEFVFIEEPIHPAQLTGATNIQTIRLAAGLAAHAESFAHAYRCRAFQCVNVERWRPDFIGRAQVSDARKDARQRAKTSGKKHSARDKLKALTIARCEQLGFNPRTDDEADALGMLDYALHVLRGITPPWRMENILLPPLEVVS